MKVVAFSFAEGYIAKHLAERVKNSFKFFHPQIPFFIFDFKDEKKLLNGEQKCKMGRREGMIKTRFIPYLLNQYDIVIILDIDTVVVARLDEFLKGDYDVAGSLAIGAFAGYKCEDYMNTGVTAITNKTFAKDWTKLSYDVDFLREKKFGIIEDDVFNYLAFSGEYKVKIVDKENYYYNERSRNYWGEIVIENGKLFANKRQLKVLHWSSGTNILNKISCKRFSKEVREFLSQITKTRDFIDVVGLDKWY